METVIFCSDRWYRKKVKRGGMGRENRQTILDMQKKKGFSKIRKSYTVGLAIEMLSLPQT